MITIRKRCFETNSSSVHALIVLTQEEFKHWQYDEGNIESTIFISNIHSDEVQFHTGEEVMTRLAENESWYNIWLKYNCDDDTIFSFAAKHLGWYAYDYVETREKEIGDKVAISIYKPE